MNAYDILYGTEMGAVIREAHVKAIRLGNRFEKLLIAHANPPLRYNVEAAPRLDKRNADILLWDRQGGKLLVLEVMLSCNIDTGKVRARYNKMMELEKIYSDHFPTFKVRVCILSPKDSRGEIIDALKGNYFKLQDVITAKMYSRIVRLDYMLIDGIISKREQQRNIQWLKESISNIK